MTRLFSRRRGFSLTEIMISILIIALVIGMVIPAMIYFARAEKGIRMQQTMQKQVNLFNQQVNLITTGSDNMTYVDGSLVVFNGPVGKYTASGSNFTYTENRRTSVLRYVDDDNDPATINDNKIELEEAVRTPGGALVDGRTRTLVLLNDVSPYKDEAGTVQPIFTLMKDRKRDYLLLQARVGDTTYPTSDVTDKITGPGYQGFLVRQILLPYFIPL